MTATCTHCSTTFHNVDRNEDGSPAIESTRCAHPGCEVYVCRAGCEHLSFECDGCRERFCAEHKVMLDGMAFCLACVIAKVESQEPECECQQTDVDLCDARGCEFHDPASPWNVRLRAVTAIQEHDQDREKGEKMQQVNGIDQPGAEAGARAPAEQLTRGNGGSGPTGGSGLAHSGGVGDPPKPSTGLSFKKAVKYAAKGRIALIGPAGSGKSYTALLLARALAGPNGKIAAIDTEHGSLSKYADIFDFDVIELDRFSPQSFVTALHAAEDAGYNVFLCDSLSHFWTGRDGALEFVDMAAKRNRDNMGGWKEFRPHERQMVDDMVSSSCHVICTMRTKTDYQEQVDANGKKKRIKIGLAPVQRDGLEYEFDLVGYMDEDNTFITDKTRCSEYSQKAYSKPGPKEFAPFVEWLKGAVGAPRPKRIEPQIDTGGRAMNTQSAADFVAQQKIAAGSPASKAFWKSMRECAEAFASIREAVGEVQWREVLDGYGWTGFPDIRRALDAKAPGVRERVVECYVRLDSIVRKAVA